MTRAAPYRWAAAGLAALFLAGCGGNTVRVTGRLVKDGQPFTVRLTGAEPDTLAVDFHGTADGAKVAFAATVAEDGTFTVPGAERKGIPRGQYRIAVLHSGFLGAGGDRFKTRYASDKTPLAVEITENATLTIDLGAGTVTK
jgi:hypothetical protein